MANLAASAVTINTFGIVFGGESARKKVVDATLVLTGQGGGVNLIPAALFGLLNITEVLCMRNAAGDIYDCAPDLNQAGIIINSPSLGGGGAIATKYIVASGLASAGNITATGVVAGDNLVEALDLTTPSELSLANFTPGAGVIAQGAGAGDIHTLKIRFAIQNFTPATAGPLVPADITDTVRVIVVGNDL